MPRAKIYGAGSIGNHLAQACRRMEWEVVVCDVDEAALQRMRTEIYPARYGRWDDAIQLCRNDRAPKGGFDCILVGTPPEHHLPLALDAVKEKPRAILVEKPACPPDMALAQELLEATRAAGIRAFVGYDHVVGGAAQAAESAVASDLIGKIVALDVEFREHWEGIFKAHPWLSGPEDTYLGYWRRGGGASGEHSHALNLWQHFAHCFGQGRVAEIEAMVTYVNEGNACYDSITTWNLRTETGLQGRVVQDVVTRPHRKAARIQGTRGAVEWVANHSPEGDAVRLLLPGMPDVLTPVNKKRPDDFLAEMRHIWECVNEHRPSPIDLARGLDTALVVAAAHLSEAQRRRMRIDWTMGYTTKAIVPCQEAS